MNEEKSGYGYGKRPLWQWIFLYVVIAGVLYGLVYYFFFAHSGYSYTPPISTSAANTTSAIQTQTAPQNSNAPMPVSVAISNMAFSPRQISVKVGTKVTWTNKDGVSHTVTSNSGVFDSGALNPGGTYNFTFNTPGTYSYHCSIHPSMTASVLVTQ